LPIVGACAWFIELQISTVHTEPAAQAKNSLPALPGKAVVGKKGIGGRRSERCAGVARNRPESEGAARGPRAEKKAARYSICREKRRIVGEIDAKRRAGM
jgi:hypothetical protein